MTVHAWLAFVVASAVLLVIPGPTVLLVIAQSLGAGRRRALPLVAGVALGDMTAMTVSLAGWGAVLSSSATAFAVMKWAGAVYLVVIGYRLWRAPVAGDAAPALAARAAFRQAYAVTSLNPKTIAFFIAFVPQFIAPDGSFVRQAAILIASFVGLAAIIALLYATLAGRLAALVRRASVRRGLNRAGGGVLMGAGLVLALRR